MDIKELYDIVYTMQLFQNYDEEDIINSMLIRTGKRFEFNYILDYYNKIKKISNQFGYTNPMNFIINFFPGKFNTQIPISSKQINKIKLQKIFCEKNSQSKNFLKEERIPSIHISQETTTNKLKKVTSYQDNSQKDEYFIKSKINKPEKLKIENSVGTSIEIPTDIKNKIIKTKKSQKYYREMSLKEKETDNKFDYYLMQSIRDESGKFYYDNREVLNDFPIIGKFFDDIDIEFRKIMAEIYNYNKNLTKDKTKWNTEIQILKKYFEVKMNIKQQDYSSFKKLGSVIAYLMKKLQLKIFETNDLEIIRILLYFKTQLSSFYNYYKK